MRGPSQKAVDAAAGVFRARGGTLRTSEAIAAGIHRRTLYWMRDQGVLEPLSRGVFHLASEPLPDDPDVVAVVQRIPGCVIALLSALDLHELTTQIPEAVYVALPRGTKQPRIAYPRVRVVQMSQEAMAAGVEERLLGETPIRVFGVAKTVADCFKYRSMVGIDVAIEALREAVQSRRATPAELMHFARVDRVARVMQPYLRSFGCPVGGIPPRSRIAMMDTQLLPSRQTVADFCRRWRIAELALFGSVLRDDFRSDSDVDVLVSYLPEARWTLLDHVRMQEELTELFGRKVDLVDRAAVERGANWIRRRSILESARTYWAA
jgi:predicted nucleotidyltransferase